MERLKEQWIWLSNDLYPENQTCRINGFQPENGKYAVAEFMRSYTYEREIDHVSLFFSGDTEYRLLCNGKLVATGPATLPGDFMCNDEIRPWHYAHQVELPVHEKQLDLYARVKLSPCGINEYSKGHGGWMLKAIVTFADGKTEEISTDESWLARQDVRYASPAFFDGRRTLPLYTQAQLIEDIWHATPAPICPRTEEEVESRKIHIAPHETLKKDFDFTAIYAGMIRMSVRTSTLLRVCVRCLETDNVSAEEHFVFTEDTEYTGLQLYSIGRYQVEIENEGDLEAELTLSICCTHYPAEYCAHTITSDDELNAVLRQCEHALKHCRQMIHLDSPLHSEPLACTGDYYIETLMTAFSFGDMTLAEFDVLRTAHMLVWQKGVMFHTTYSLIWVLWLYDVYLFTGHKKLLADCEEALHILMDRMRSYKGENGLIETPPSFMFIDWLYLDDISLHHPPKALGQSCLNMFYAAALKRAALICHELGNGRGTAYALEAEQLCAAINQHLFDAEKGLYFEGLNTPTPQQLLDKYMPANVSKRYFRKHANILAAYAGVYPGDTASFLTRVLDDDSLGDFQPYFAHFAMEAINQNGLADRYLLRLCQRWKEAYRACPKGLQEGFIKPEPTYTFDHSHAWGGTPLWSVPLALSGLKILEPGMRKIALAPNLMGLTYAVVEIPTPFGVIRLEMEQGKEVCVTAPMETAIIMLK